MVPSFHGAAVPVVGAAVVIDPVMVWFPALSRVHFAVPAFAKIPSVVVPERLVVVSNRYALFVPLFATIGATLNLSVAHTIPEISSPVVIDDDCMRFNTLTVCVVAEVATLSIVITLPCAVSVPLFTLSVRLK